MCDSDWGVIIPAYQAAETLPAVLAGVSTTIPRDRILVVDDGSTDDTSRIVERAGAHLLRRTVNGGKGQALRDGMALTLTWRVDWLLLLDADGQHDPARIPDFQRLAAQGHHDLIIGDRTGDFTGMPRARRLSNRLSSVLLSWRMGQRLPDVQCGYRAIKKMALQRMSLTAKRYDVEVEMIWQALKMDLRIGWLPIPTIYHHEVSHLRKFPETWRFFRSIARTFYER